MPSYILHCSSSRSLDRHNKLQCNKTKVQTSAGYPQETNALNTVFCTVEYRSKKHFHTPHPKQSCNNQISSGAVANPRNPCSNKLCSRGVDAMQLTLYFKTPSTPQVAGSFTAILHSHIHHPLKSTHSQQRDFTLRKASINFGTK